MYGHDILVHFFTGMENQEYNFTFPTESAFVNLGNFDLIPPGSTLELRPTGPLSMFQRAGTVVPM